MVPEVDVHTFAAAHSDGALVIDVREPDEYVAGHVPGAKLIPLARLPHHAGGLPGRRAGVRDLRVREPQLDCGAVPHRARH